MLNDVGLWFADSANICFTHCAGPVFECYGQETKV